MGRPNQVITIEQDKTVKAAALTMKSHKVGCLIVNNPQGEFVGLVTERDIANWVACSPNGPEAIQVGQIMTRDVVSCAPGTPSSQAREIMATHGIRHLPIVDHGSVIGILSVRDLMGQQIAEDRAAAEQVAMLSNCLKSIDFEEAARIVTQEAPKLFDAHKCVLCLYPNGDTSKAPELESHTHCLRPQESLREVLDSGQVSGLDALFIEAVPAECGHLGACGPRLVIPINVSGSHENSGGQIPNLCGYLCMCGLAPERSTNTELISYKAKLAKEILTSHLTNATLYQQARLTSLTDALTGVGSRRMLEDAMQSEYVRAQRYGNAFSLAIIDLDNFKSINDVLGHATGDEVIKKLAAVLKQQKRIPDVLARYGGDEFILVMPETEAHEAAVVLERLRNEVHKIHPSPDTSLTISCGVAQTLFDRNESPTDVMRRADLALYEAKGAGRDCVRIWDKNMIQLLNANDIEIGKVKQLQRRVAGLSEKAEKMFMQSIWGLVQTLEAKSPFGRNHSENVMLYAVGIAKAMNVGPKHTDLIRRAAMLHDIGKIGIPDAILSKPDKLTPRERKTVEQHPLIAVRILDKMNFLERELQIVRHHHEKWNGQGYPEGLAKTAIPVGARVVALADTLDAITSLRSYRDPLPLSEAVKIVVDSSSYEFDPEVAKGLVCWIETLSRELARSIDQITAEDLLRSQREDPANLAALESVGDLIAASV